MSTIGSATSDRDMRFDLTIFDFDGTLVRSSAIKYRAFFEMIEMSRAQRQIVSDVLEDDPDGSRFEVIPRMHACMVEAGCLNGEVSADNLVAAYANAVQNGVAACPESEGAGDLIAALASRCPVYVVSNTPHGSLLSLLEARGWLDQITGAFGHPNEKPKTVAALMARHGAGPDATAVIGDGVSDEAAARENGCHFVKANEHDGLQAVMRQLELGGV